MITFGSLFAGIGGLDLGLERAGMRCEWQVEWNNYAVKVLAKHWPNVRRVRDVRDANASNLTRVDLICGGFPCQDISYAGKGAGLTGKRSGLWFEFARIIRELEPKYVLVENVAALLDRGMGDVLGSLASLGYDAEWSIVPACAMGAPHTRERLFILAYPQCDGRRERNRIVVRDRHGLPKQQRHHAPKNEKWERFRNQTSGGGEAEYRGTWRDDASIRRVADGIPDRVERIRGLGNAVVPQVAEFIGRMIMEHADAHL